MKIFRKIARFCLLVIEWWCCRGWYWETKNRLFRFDFAWESLWQLHHFSNSNFYYFHSVFLKNNKFVSSCIVYCTFVIEFHLKTKLLRFSITKTFRLLNVSLVLPSYVCVVQKPHKNMYWKYMHKLHWKCVR